MPSHDPLIAIFAEQVKSGMMLDLENDAYADPKGDNNAFKDSYVTVDSVEIETEGCVRIDFIDADSVGFPLKHKLYLHNNSELELSESL